MCAWSTSPKDSLPTTSPVVPRNTLPVCVCRGWLAHSKIPRSQGIRFHRMGICNDSGELSSCLHRQEIRTLTRKVFIGTCHQ